MWKYIGASRLAGSGLSYHFALNAFNKGTQLETAPRKLHTSCNWCHPFWEPHYKGDTKYAVKHKTFTKEKVADALKDLRPEFGKLVEEVKEHFRADQYILPPPDGVVDVLTSFNGPESLQNWVISCDSDHNEGFSKAQLTSTTIGFGCFSGDLSTRLPNDGRVKAAGWCNLRAPLPTRSFHRPIPYYFDFYTHLVFRIRGDGRTYMVNLHCPGIFDVTWLDVFQYPLFTRGGPYFQVTKIPFSKFVQQYKGRVQDFHCHLPRDNVKAISISICDRNNGPFNLEIDYIGVERIGNPNREESVYEAYDIPVHLAT